MYLYSETENIFFTVDAWIYLMMVNLSEFSMVITPPIVGTMYGVSYRITDNKKTEKKKYERHESKVSSLDDLTGNIS